MHIYSGKGGDIQARNLKHIQIAKLVGEKKPKQTIKPKPTKPKQQIQ